jgi:hypothetical protein
MSSLDSIIERLPHGCPKELTGFHCRGPNRFAEEVEEVHEILANALLIVTGLHDLGRRIVPRNKSS